MGWIRLETDWYMHPKFSDLGKEAGLFWALVSWANHYMTDGNFTLPQAQSVGAPLGFAADEVSAACVTLVKRALLIRTPSGFAVHGYLERYADALTRKAARDRARELTRVRVRNLRNARRNVPVTRVTGAVCNAPVPSYPLPSSLQSGKEKTRKESRLRCKSAWPAELVLDDAMAAYARRFGCKRPELSFAMFRDRCLATGATYVDWKAAWRNWCGRHERFGCACQAATAPARERKYVTAKSLEERYAREEANQLGSGGSKDRRLTTESQPEHIGNILETFALERKAEAT